MRRRAHLCTGVGACAQPCTGVNTVYSCARVYRYRSAKLGDAKVPNYLVHPQHQRCCASCGPSVMFCW